MKQNDAKKKLIRAYSIVVLMVLSTLAWTMTNGAGHGVTIAKPENNSIYNNLYNKPRVTTEKTALTFDFTIDNHDGYLIKYDAWIDGVADPKLNDPNWTPSLALAHYVISYDAQQFLDNYGQGSHTFTVAIYHGTPYVRPPFGLQEGDNPDDDDIYWVGNQGYLLSLVDEVSVTFTFDPVVVHYVGFWYQDNEDNFSTDILGFKELLWDNNAHYLHGYSYLTGSWSSSTPLSIFEELKTFENQNDIDIIHFCSHGAITDLKFVEIQWGIESSTGYYSELDLHDDLLDSNLISSNIILFIDACHSEMFIDTLAEVPNLTILTACMENESALFYSLTSYDPEWSFSWSLDTKLNYMISDFTRGMAKALYSGLDLVYAFNNLNNTGEYCIRQGEGSTVYICDNNICLGNQHPVSFNLYQEIYFYINNSS